MPECKRVRFGVKYGKFVLVYERIVEKLEPAKQLKDTKPKLIIKHVDIYT